MAAFVRSEADIFRLADAGFVQAVCNPVSISAQESGGLFQVFKDKFPGAYTQYIRACINESLHVGDILIHKNDSIPYYALTLPTRESVYDKSSPVDIKKAVAALAGTIAELGVDVAVPIIGCGRNYEHANVSLPIMLEWLEPLSTTTHICVRDQYFTTPPVILGVLTSASVDVGWACAKLGSISPIQVITTDRTVCINYDHLSIQQLTTDENRFGNLESAIDYQYKIILDAATHLVIDADSTIITHKPTLRLPL